MGRLRLPIGIQDFGAIRRDGCYYLDRAPHVRWLDEGGRHYFLSRPRRFGRSLPLDTMKALFEGCGELFRGLDIHDGRDWSVTHPACGSASTAATKARPISSGKSSGNWWWRSANRASVPTPPLSPDPDAYGAS